MWAVLFWGIEDNNDVSVDVFEKRENAEKYVDELKDSGYRHCQIVFRSLMDSAFE